MKMSDLRLVIPHRRMIGDVCDITGEDPYVLAAIGLRESRFGFAAPYWPKGTPDGWGDGSTESEPSKGYGYGYFQIDRRFHRDFLNRQDRSDPSQQAKYACSILRDNRAWFKRNPSIPTGDAERLQRMVVAAYNCGCGNVRKCVSEGLDIDARTTGKDYSRWVLAVAEDLRSVAPDLFSPESVPVPPRPVPDAEAV